MSSSVAVESHTPISGGCRDGGGTTSSVADSPMKDEAVDSNPFQEGERVLAFHGACLYDAKGWNKNWDEWLGSENLLKHNEANIRKQKELKEKHSGEKSAKPGRPSQDKAKNFTGARGRKRKHETVKKEESFVPSEKHVNIQIPSSLKKQLVEDHESITQLGQLVKLPRSPSAYEILNKYFDYQVKKDDIYLDKICQPQYSKAVLQSNNVRFCDFDESRIVEAVKEIVDGLLCYFDKALPAMLLYKEERQQYKELIADNVSPSGVYGAEHLLRLFVKLPEMLSCAHIEMETLSELQHRLLDFLRFLQSNQSEFFDSDYQKGEDAVKEEES